MLRPYQQAACDAVMDFVRKLREPCLVEAATGSGKSHIIAHLAHEIHCISAKRILCLAPSAELVEQNYEKYLLTGNKASIYSASAGQKSLRHPVVFGTPMTVLNRIDKFHDSYAAVFVDEAHGITPTIQAIISKLRGQNPNLRVVGMSATPYRLGTGYIYAQTPDGKPVEESEAPYFRRLVYRITAPELIEMGFLTPPKVGTTGEEHYETLGMQLNSRGQFNASDVDRAYHGMGRKTAKIIENVVENCRNRRGVIIYAATVRHAQECMQSLPRELSEIVTGDTPRAERRRMLEAFKREEIKYLVNVGVLTTGFDAPHVDAIAILRATESVALLQQIIGRGLRLCEAKTNCLVLDYAENIERHCPDGDVFNPKVRVRRKGEAGRLVALCPLCNFPNEFAKRDNKDGFEINEAGYFVDLDGNEIQTDWGAMPAHHGRRCQATVPVAGDLVQCGYRWTSKTCEACGHDNDIAARFCADCKAELVNPNEKLKIEFTLLKRDPTRLQTDNVVGWVASPTITRAGKSAYIVNVVTEYRKFTYWVLQTPAHHKGQRALQKLLDLNMRAPKTITYQKNAGTQFYDVLDYNRPADEAPHGSKDIRKYKLPGGVPQRDGGAGDLLCADPPGPPADAWEAGNTHTK